MIERLTKVTEEKVEKDSAKARYVGPKEGPFRCDRCVYFIKPRGCKEVKGDIDPQGCCNLFKRDPTK